MGEELYEQWTWGERARERSSERERDRERGRGGGGGGEGGMCGGGRKHGVVGMAGGRMWGNLREICAERGIWRGAGRMGGKNGREERAGRGGRFHFFSSLSERFCRVARSPHVCVAGAFLCASRYSALITAPPLNVCSAPPSTRARDCALHTDQRRPSAADALLLQMRFFVRVR